MKVLVVDALGRGTGRRIVTVDVIGVGPRAVVSALRVAGASSVDLMVLENVFNNVKSLARDYDVLAVSFMVGDEKGVSRLLDLWHRYGGKYVILGGPGTLNKDFLESIDFNLAVCGEFEYIAIMIKQLGGLEYVLREPYQLVKSVSGVYFKVENRIVGSGIAPNTPRDILYRIRPSVDVIRKYPFYWASRVYVEVVRGCSNYLRPRYTFDGRECINCNRCHSRSNRDRLTCPVMIPPGCGYCNVPLLFGYPRSIPVDIVYEEVKKLISMGVTRIVLSAPDFLDYGRDLMVYPEPLTNPREPPPNIDEIEKLLRRITSITEVLEGIVSISIENVKACLVNEYVAEVLGKYLKGSVIYIGLESADNELLQRIGRPSTVEECIKAIELLRRYGLRPYVYLMHGIPGETVESLRKTTRIVDDLERLGVEKIVLYRFRPLPGSAFEKAPKPLPAIYREGAKELYERVRLFNKNRKNLLLNKVLRVVVACSHPTKSGYLIAYPLHHGPVVLIRASKRFIGHVVDVKVEKVISERIVEGRLLYSRRRLPVDLTQ